MSALKCDGFRIYEDRKNIGGNDMHIPISILDSEKSPWRELINNTEGLRQSYETKTGIIYSYAYVESVRMLDLNMEQARIIGNPAIHTRVKQDIYKKHYIENGEEISQGKWWFKYNFLPKLAKGNLRDIVMSPFSKNYVPQVAFCPEPSFDN